MPIFSIEAVQDADGGSGKAGKELIACLPKPLPSPERLRAGRSVKKLSLYAHPLTKNQTSYQPYAVCGYIKKQI
jgi:hypothetical protein